MSVSLVILLSATQAQVLHRQAGALQTRFVTWTGEASPQQRAQAIQEALAQAGHEPALPVLLALSSCDCLSAVISTAQLPRSGRKQAMLYALEEHLPLSAEEIVADFVPSSEDQALGVACELTPLRTMIQALEALGVLVDRIVPWAMLLAGYAQTRHPSLQALLLATPRPLAEGHAQENSPPAWDYDALAFHDGKLADWKWLAWDCQAAASWLQSLMPTCSAAQPLVLLGPDQAWTSLPLPVSSEQVIRLTDNLFDAACAEAERIRGGLASPLVDLRRDALAAPDHRVDAWRGWLQVAAAALVLLVSLNIALHGRSAGYRQLARQSLQAQADVFKQVLPQQRVPAGNIKGRLVSEQRKLAGLSGQAQQGLAQEATPSALGHFQQILGAIPRDLRIRILELSIEPELVRIDGQARSHADAERLATLIRQTGGYEVEPPRTQSLREQGVSFNFTARPRASRAVPSRGAP